MFHFIASLFILFPFGQASDTKCDALLSTLLPRPIQSHGVELVGYRDLGPERRFWYQRLFHTPGFYIAPMESSSLSQYSYYSTKLHEAIAARNWAEALQLRKDWSFIFRGGVHHSIETLDSIAIIDPRAQKMLADLGYIIGDQRIDHVDRFSKKYAFSVLYLQQIPSTGELNQRIIRLNKKRLAKHQIATFYDPGGAATADHYLIELTHHGRFPFGAPLPESRIGAQQAEFFDHDIHYHSLAALSLTPRSKEYTMNVGKFLLDTRSRVEGPFREGVQTLLGRFAQNVDVFLTNKIFEYVVKGDVDRLTSAISYVVRPLGSNPNVAFERVPNRLVREIFEKFRAPTENDLRGIAVEMIEGFEATYGKPSWELELLRPLTPEEKALL